MTAIVRKIKPSGPGSDEPFDWTCTTVTAPGESGEQEPVQLTVPSLAKLPKPNQFKLLKLQEQDPSGVVATRYILLNGLGEDTLEILEAMDGDESDSFMKAWEQHSGTTLGKLRDS